MKNVSKIIIILIIALMILSAVSCGSGSRAGRYTIDSDSFKKEMKKQAEAEGVGDMFTDEMLDEMLAEFNYEIELKEDNTFIMSNNNEKLEGTITEKDGKLMLKAKSGEPIPEFKYENGKLSTEAEGIELVFKKK